jgi:leucine dehydrogenase
VFVPCGLGGVLTHEVVDALRVAAPWSAPPTTSSRRATSPGISRSADRLGARLRVKPGGVIYLDVASVPGADQAALDARIASIGDTRGIRAAVGRGAHGTTNPRGRRASRARTPRRRALTGRPPATRLVP